MAGSTRAGHSLGLTRVAYSRRKWSFDQLRSALVAEPGGDR